MNSTFLSVAVLLAGFAQLLPSVPAPGGGAGATTPEAPPMKVRVLAFQALDTDEPKTDPELRSISRLLREFEYDTFRFVNDIEREVNAEGQASLTVNPLYTFHAALVGQSEDGGVMVASRIEMLDGNRYVNALRTEGVVEPGKWLVFRGLPINRGELVMMMTLVQDQDDQQGDSSDEQEQGESDEDQESDDRQQEQDQDQDQEQGEGEDAEGERDMDDDRENEGGEGEGEDDSQRREPEDGSDSEEAQDLGQPEIEALLESLDETDRREQLRQHESHTRPFLPSSGEWW